VSREGPHFFEPRSDQPNECRVCWGKKDNPDHVEGEAPSSIDDARALVEQRLSEAEVIGAEHSSTALVPTGAAAPEVKRQMALVRSTALRKGKELAAAKHAMERRLNAEMERVQRMLDPLQEMVRQLEEGIWTVNLYLGRDEEIVTLATGEPASEDTPITVRQMVLSMDQEARVAADSGGIDARQIETFDEWLLATPEHLDQVLPEKRGVVVLVPRETPADYGDPWLQKEMDRANRHSYWLIRNGENLYRIDTEFNVGKHLIPTRDEFTSFFQVKDRRTNEVRNLEPGSEEWMRAEKAADARKRHFMRVALVLQGLVDRTAVLRPLPGPVNFLGPESYDAGHVVVVTDAEQALGTGREPYRKWIKRLNAELRPGMRIVGNFGWSAKHNEDFRVHPSTAPGPREGEIYVIEDRDGSGELIIRYPWKRYGYEHGDWGRYGEWEAKNRASCKIQPRADNIIPFDLVTLEEVQAYIDARTERHNYIDLIPLLKSVVEAKEAERKEEAPFRTLLAGEIAKFHLVSIERAEEAVADLVDWWKLANRWHRPLVEPDQKTQARAVKAIAAEFGRRSRDAEVASEDGGREQEMVEHLRRQHPEAILVARKRNGHYVVLVPANDDNVYAHRYTYTATGKQPSDHESPWVLPGVTWKRWRVLWSAERWGQWDHAATASSHLTGPEFESAVQEWTALLAEHGHQVIAFTDGRAGSRTENGAVAWLAPDEVELPWERPLTGRMPKDHWPEVECAWKRTTGRRVETSIDAWRGSVRIGHMACGPGSGQFGGTILWQDEEAVKRAGIVMADIERFEKERSRQQAPVNRALASIEATWMERAEREAYERFIEDYADPSLWEDHRKGVKIEFPHGDITNRGRNQGMYFWLCRLIEEGMDIDGMTLGQAAEHAKALDEEVVDDEWPAGSMWSKAVTVPEIPDEIADLVMSAESDDDDEEEDDAEE
jgi:hypothetical protein